MFAQTARAAANPTRNPHRRQTARKLNAACEELRPGKEPLGVLIQVNTSNEVRGGHEALREESTRAVRAFEPRRAAADLPPGSAG